MLIRLSSGARERSLSRILEHESAARFDDAERASGWP